jgi:hypothetical protein
LLCALISLGLATFLFLRKPGDRAALIISFFLLAFGFIISGPLEMVEYLVSHQIGPVAWRIQAIIGPPMILVLLLTFPNGIITPARFRWLIPFTIVLCLLMGILPPEDLFSVATWRGQLANSLLGILLLFGVAAQVYRYTRKASQVERQQTKIALYGLGIQFVLLFISSAIFYQAAPVAQYALTPDGLSTGLFWFISLIILPISITLAVFRSHLWDIDVVIRRTLIYGMLTAALGMVYFSSVVLIQALIRLTSGQGSPVAILISTLAIYVLFQPLRRRIQSAIDRRFYRSKYNAEQALASFQNRLRERADLDQMEDELTRIVQETVQPQRMMLWMRQPDKK